MRARPCSWCFLALYVNEVTSSLFVMPVQVSGILVCQGTAGWEAANLLDAVREFIVHYCAIPKTSEQGQTFAARATASDVDILFTDLQQSLQTAWMCESAVPGTKTMDLNRLLLKTNWQQVLVG